MLNKQKQEFDKILKKNMYKEVQLEHKDRIKFIKLNH